MKNFIAIVLAAGEGTRMKSDKSKVLHPICGKPMLEYVIEKCGSLKIAKTAVVAGKNFSQLKMHLPKNISLARQIKPKGTADAVAAAKSFIRHDNVLVVYGDTPLLSRDTILKLMKTHLAENASMTLLTVRIDNPQGYGRIIRDKNGEIICIKEDKDLLSAEGFIKEINAGICCFKAKDLLNVIGDIRPNNNKKEYYLTDAVRLLALKNKKIAYVEASNSYEAEGINDQGQIANIEKVMRKEIIRKLMRNGVRFIDPDNTYVEDGVKIGRDTVVYPGTYIEKDCFIGNCCKVGPHAHIRGNSKIANNVLIGNFVEINRSLIGEKTMISHFSYIGDSKVGKEVNIGAGTVTANFDGKKKNKTIIGDNAFIGSGTILVAPIKIGKNSVTGAGCVVPKNKNVKDNCVVVGVPARLLKRS